MKFIKSALCFVFAAFLFASCVSSPAPLPHEPTTDNDTVDAGDEEGLTIEEKIDEQKEPEPPIIAEKDDKGDFSNGFWVVRGKNGSQVIENATSVAVDGAKGVCAVIRVQSQNKISVLLEGFSDGKDVNTWSSQFSVSVKDKYEIEFVLNDAMRNGKLIFNPSNSELVNDLLKEGGALEFFLTNDEKPSEQYWFEIENPEGSYEEAFAELLSRDVAD